jgi:hypothetical protein
MTDILLLPLMVYAAAGLLLSLTVHVLSIAGFQPGGTGLFSALHVGIFPLWVPVVLLANKMSGGAQRMDLWKAALSGCPLWMKYMTYGFFIYAFVNFAIFFVIAPTGKQTGGAPPSAVWHGFSGHWMAFYSGGLAIVTSAYRRGLANLSRRCRNGHVVGYDDRFCPTCGVPVDGEQRPLDRAVDG